MFETLQESWQRPSLPVRFTPATRRPCPPVASARQQHSTSKTVNIAVISFLGSGDWLQAFEAGVKRQADALGIKLTVSQARNDNDTQRNLVEQAINLGVDGIIINNGRPEVLKDVAQKALDAGIKVVAYDVDLDNPQIPQIEQSDKDMASLVLEQAVKDKGDGFVGGAVYVAGFAPLDRRYGVWKDFRRHGIMLTESRMGRASTIRCRPPWPTRQSGHPARQPGYLGHLHALGRIRQGRKAGHR